MSQPNTSAQRAQDQRWTKLPDAILPHLTPREHQLVHALLSYRWTDQSPIVPSIKTLARQVGCSERTIQRTTRTLAAKGYLIIEARYRGDQGQTSNLFRPGPLLVALLPPSRDGAVTAPDHDHHPPVTRVPYERDPRNQTPRTRPQERGYVYPPRDGSSLMVSRYGPVIRR